MNWILRKSKKITGHTYLEEILKPLADDIKNYLWIISDLELGGGYEEGFILNMNQDYFILSHDDFKKVLNSHVQIYWGAVIAVPGSTEIKLNGTNIPFVEGNALIWKDGNLQCPGAEIEIDCFDSGYTIIKFNREDLSKKFKTYFDEAIELEKFQ